MQVHALRRAAKEPLSELMGTPNKALSEHRRCVESRARTRCIAPVAHTHPSHAANPHDVHRSYVVKATSGGGFVKCKGCAKQLCSDSIKLGVIHSHADGFVLVHWYHLGCLECPVGLHVSDIEGAARLRDAERERVRSWAARSEPAVAAEATTAVSSSPVAPSAKPATAAVRC